MNQHIPTGLVYYQDQYDEPNFLGNCYFEIKKPADCSITQLHHFYMLLKKGNKVSPVDLPLKIFNAAFLAFCYNGKRLVGISAIKKPSLTYLKDVHQKAGISNGIHQNFLEVGYSFTRESVRRKGISSTLKRMLLKKINDHQGILFSTTATPSSQRFLLFNGFRQKGNPYQGKFDNNIIYFEKNVTA
ncbi:hypothetical protein ASE74_20120 [Pedobacter sp. Leaf216]|uniref:N-acetyltransferase n=1 Tax=Pedobacter sp. Leaf216 TaxID=1735684 RepID=UPI0006F709BD|nr:N-acetyltransferase [Pedobacter sp. Leaf216]KQM76353.1 hypothetical protein ASE74_20120 [Pedobacter sp. Leaf216]